MIRILFVDDEPKVLSGLRRMLRRYRQEWEMEFVESGHQAREVLRTKPFDVIVSDMRMPEMDGATLLGLVQAEFPSIIRIVLSGHSDREHVMRAVGPSHQYLSKPCDPETLRQAIVDACTARERIGSERIREMVGRTDDLPTLPDVYVALVEELQSPAASIARAGEIISGDIGTSARILRLVNSSFFGLPVHVTDVSHAVALLGLDVIKPLVLSTGLFQQFQPGSLGSFSLGKVVDHSLEVGLASRCLTQLEGLSTESCDHAYMAGLLHDLGQLILAQRFPERYDEVRATATAEGTPLVDLETAEFEANHADVGAYLLGLWGLPNEVVDAVASHHAPEWSPISEFTPLTAIHVSEYLLHPPDGQNYENASLSETYVERLDLKPRLQEWSNMLGADTAETISTP